MSEPWTTHCPRCSDAVVVVGEPDDVLCSSCGDRFPPEALPTARYRHGAPDPVDPNDPLVGARLGRWRVLRLVGRGGMGRVYEGADRLRRRRVAVKVLSDRLAADAAFRKRFDRESETLGEFEHPHIVRVVDRGEDDGHLWFAMDYVRGESLRRRLARGPLPAAEAVAVATQIASALAYAHERGVVHRDLKPENVLLGEDGVARLVDFGLSAWHGERIQPNATRLTHTDVIMGTYEYMAPEQRRGDREIGPAADLFALGVILYEALTGTLPVGRFQLPSEHSAHVSRRLDAIVAKALAPDAARRYASATDLQRDLADALRGGPDPDVVAPEQDPAPSPADDGPVLRHVEVLVGIDRVIAVLALLAALGATGVLFQLVTPRLSPFPRSLFFGSSIVLGIAGLLLWRQGGRLSRFEDGSREAQMTTNLIFLFFPPILTLAGVYGLWALSGERPRRVFARRRPERPVIGRHAHGIAAAAPSPSFPMAAPHAPAASPSARPTGPSWLLRAFLLGAILWGAYALIVGLEVLLFRTTDSPSSRHMAMAMLQPAIHGTAVALLLGCVWSVTLFLRRRERRGVALALIATTILTGVFVLLMHCYVTTRESGDRRHASLPDTTARHRTVRPG